MLTCVFQVDTASEVEELDIDVSPAPYSVVKEQRNSRSSSHGTGKTTFNFIY